MTERSAPHLSTGLHIAIVGPGDGVTPEQAAMATEVGRLAAEAGAVVVTGGGGGVMAAAARGASAAGGIVVGLLPGTDRNTAVGPLTVAIPTGLGEIRNGLVVRAADVVIAVGGSWGTASEIALAMRTGVPVIAIGGWHFTDAAGNEIELVRADTAEAAVGAAIRLRPRPR